MNAFIAPSFFLFIGQIIFQYNYDLSCDQVSDLIFQVIAFRLFIGNQPVYEICPEDVHLQWIDNIK